MLAKKILLATAIFSLTSTWVFWYSEVECSSDPAFLENSCNQCFDWWAKEEGVNIGFLSDDWINNTDIKQLIYKEEQSMPRMVNLDWANVSWSQDPSADWFWEYTEDLDALFSQNENGYVLDAGQSVTWLKSKLGYSYKLDKNTASDWANIWMLVYPISVHNIMSDGDMTIDSTVHNECVLYKSTSSEVATITSTPPERLPDTWPSEYILLMILAVILWFGFVRFAKRS